MIVRKSFNPPLGLGEMQIAWNYSGYKMILGIVFLPNAYIVTWARLLSGNALTI